jgi:uncharacterized membrane protein YfcA
MQDAVLIGAGGLIAGIVSGASGFGFALVATALWSHFLEPSRVTTLALVFMLSLNVMYLPVFWRQIPWARLVPLAVGGVIGVPLGAAALGVLPGDVMRRTVGAVLLAYAVHMLWRGPRAPVQLPPSQARWVDGAVGFVGGVLGGLASLAGVLPTLWVALQGGDKTSNRALVQAYILLVGAMGIAWVGRFVGIDEQARSQLWLGMPFVLVGGLIGLRLFARMSTPRFNKCVLILLGVCGALLLGRG